MLGFHLRVIVLVDELITEKKQQQQQKSNYSVPVMYLFQKLSILITCKLGAKTCMLMCFYILLNTTQ